MFTVTVRVQVRHKDEPARVMAAVGQIDYLKTPLWYGLLASLIRAFLIFFYAKRLLLIYLILMDSVTGIRVHRLGLIERVPNAEARLNEHQQVLLRTLDSFPRVWASFLLRGIQGRHGLLDPLGFFLSLLLQARYRLLLWMKPEQASLLQAPVEPSWSRLLREEEIALLGQMQDRSFALEALVDLVLPRESTTMRGRLLYFSQGLPYLGPFIHWYIILPETTVRARIIEEIARLVERALLAQEESSALLEGDDEALTT